MRYFLHLAYNGAPFYGWQIQPDHISVQEVLEKSLSMLLHQERIAITGCGRTDTGVHASDYYAHFDIEEDFTEEKCQKILNHDHVNRIELRLLQFPIQDELFAQHLIF